MSRADELIDQRHEEVLGAIKEVGKKVDGLDHRIRKVEVEQGVLKWALGAVTTGVTGFFVWLVKG